MEEQGEKPSIPFANKKTNWGNIQIISNAAKGATNLVEAAALVLPLVSAPAFRIHHAS
jgi:hypothetical protein